MYITSLFDCVCAKLQPLTGIRLSRIFDQRIKSTSVTSFVKMPISIKRGGQTRKMCFNCYSCRTSRCCKQKIERKKKHLVFRRNTHIALFIIIIVFRVIFIFILIFFIFCWSGTIIESRSVQSQGLQSVFRSRCLGGPSPLWRKVSQGREEGMETGTLNRLTIHPSYYWQSDTGLS